MEDSTETRKATALNKLKFEIRASMRKVAHYEAAIARLSSTAEDEWIPNLNFELQSEKRALEDLGVMYKSIAQTHHTERLPEELCVSVISIAELLQVVSAERKTCEDFIAISRSRNHFYNERRRMNLELWKIKSELRARSNQSVEVTEDNSKIQELENNIKELHDNWVKRPFDHEPSTTRVYETTVAANRAAKSDLNVPGMGRWSPMPAPITVTTAPATASFIQTKDADISSNSIAAGTNIEASNAITKSKTAIIEEDAKPLDITPYPPVGQYANVKRIEQQVFNIGDISWFPVLRPSLCESSSDFYGEFGYICAKNYPLIIVEKLDDCMLGLIISTSNGNGLSRKGSSVRNRSVLVTTQSTTFHTSSDWGQSLYPRQALRVEHSSNYSPRASAYVDMLNVIMIPYDSRFEKKGNLVEDDVLPLQQMRLSAVLTTSRAGTSGSHSRFWSWLGKWWKQV
jgi:hypothetical protein